MGRAVQGSGVHRGLFVLHDLGIYAVTLRIKDLHFRATEKEYLSWETGAAAAKITLSKWVRRVLNKAVAKKQEVTRLWHCPDCDWEDSLSDEAALNGCPKCGGIVSEVEEGEMGT